MAAKPQKAPAIDWEEFDKLLLVEKPGPEWVSFKDLCVRFGKNAKNDAFRRKVDTNKNLERKQFLQNGTWTNYYRPKK